MRVIAKFYEVFLFTILAMMIAVVGAVEIPKLLGYSPYVVLSGSMEPKVPTGAIAYTNTSDHNVAVGDIVSYTVQGVDQYEEDIMVLHRIVGQREDGSWITKGDANDTEDGVIVKPEMIVGKYAFNIPMLGFVMAKVSKKVQILVFFWTIGLVILSFIFDYLAEPEEDSDSEPVAQTKIRRRAAN